MPTVWERIAAFALYVLAYLYVRNLWTLFRAPPGKRLWLLVFFAAFVVLGEMLHRDVQRPRESWVWLGCACLCLTSLLLGRGRAWSEASEFWGNLTVLFLHGFAVWWLLSRSGRLSEGRSGHLLPLDAVNILVLIPFRHYFLRVRTDTLKSRIMGSISGRNLTALARLAGSVRKPR